MAGTFITSVILAVETAALNQSANMTVMPTPTPAAGVAGAGISLITIIDGISKGTMIYVIVLLALLIMMLYIFIQFSLTSDSGETSSLNRDILSLVDKIKDYPLSESSKTELMKKIIEGAQEPKNIVGTTRRTIALTILMVIGVSIFLIILLSENSELVNTVVTSLVSVFATVVGFYFGGAQATDLLKKKSADEGSTSPPDNPPGGSGTAPAGGTQGAGTPAAASTADNARGAGK